MDMMRFIEELETKAKSLGVYEQAQRELREYQAQGKLDYLYFVSEYIRRLRDAGIGAIMTRIYGGSSLLSYLCGIHFINPLEHQLPSTLFFRRCYMDGRGGICFFFALPQKKRGQALEVLREMTAVQEENGGGSIVYFREKGDALGLFGHPLLDRLEDAMRLFGEEQDPFLALSEAFNESMDPSVLEYLFEEDSKGYWLPNLKGCVFGPLHELYELMEIAKPKSLDEFAKILCLRDARFLDQGLFLEQMKTHGLERMISSREDLFATLAEGYGVSEDTIVQIIESVLIRHRLSEAEEILLASYEVPEVVLSQLRNIRHLPYRSMALQMAALAYALAKRKRMDPERFGTLLSMPHKGSFVGPFFWIGGKLFAHKDPLSHHHPYERFANDPISHFEYFFHLGIDADYGNFPRGRVLYDGFKGKFMVYLDVALWKKSIKEQILEAYCLKEHDVMFLRDAHYRHDGLY